MVTKKAKEPDEEAVVKHITNITKALKKNDIKLFIYELYAFQKYLDETLLKVHPHINKPDKIQSWMMEHFSTYFKEDIPNERMFLAVQELLTEKKYSLGEKEGKSFENLIRVETAFFIYYKVLGGRGISENANKYVGEKYYEGYIDEHRPKIQQYIEEAEKRHEEDVKKSEEDMIKHFSMEMTSSQALKSIEESYPDEEHREYIKPKFVKYQIEHAREIYNDKLNQRLEFVKEEMKEKFPSYKDYLNKNGDGKGDVLYEGHDEDSLTRKFWEKNYIDHIIPNEAKKEVGSVIAYDFLYNIQNTILTTDWKVGKFGGTTISTGGKEKKVPKNMVKMLDIIADAYDKDPLRKNGEIWLKAFNQVAEIGAKAANKFSLFRDAKTQEVYKSFVTAYKDITKAEEDNDERNRPNLLQ